MHYTIFDRDTSGWLCFKVGSQENETGKIAIASSWVTDSTVQYCVIANGPPISHASSSTTHNVVYWTNHLVPVSLASIVYFTFCSCKWIRISSVHYALPTSSDWTLFTLPALLFLTVKWNTSRKHPAPEGWQRNV